MDIEPEFKKGDIVRTIYGETRIVIYQDGLRVFVEEESNSWYHPKKLFKTNKSNTIKD